MHYRRIWIFVFLFTLTAINYADRVALSVAAKPISIEFDLSPVAMGFLLSSFLWMYVVCLIPVGLLVDRFGGKIVNAAGIGLWSAATMLTGLSPGFWFMALSRIVMGMGESTSWPASNRIIREWFPASERGLANAIFGAGAAAGPAIGAVAIAVVVSSFGWRAGFFVAGSMGFVWLLAWLLAFDKPERVRWLSPAERTRIIAERDGTLHPELAERPAASLRQLLARRTTWGLFLTQGCEVFGGYMLLTWLPTFLQTARGLNVLHAGMLTSIPFGVAAVAAIFLGRLSDKLLTHDGRLAGKRRLLLAAMLVSDAVHPSGARARFALGDRGCAHHRAHRRRRRQRHEFRTGDRPGAQPRRYRQGHQHHRARRQYLRHAGTDRHRLRRRPDRQLQRQLRADRRPGAVRRRGDADHDAAADRGGGSAPGHGGAGLTAA